MPLTRRALLATAPTLLAAAPSNPIADIERSHGGRLGVFALNTGTGATLAHRPDERFLLASTFKGPLAAYVLARIDAGQDTPGTALHFAAKDLLPNSPISTAMPLPAPSHSKTPARPYWSAATTPPPTSCSLIPADPPH